jgi:hypothetical protein
MRNLTAPGSPARSVDVLVCGGGCAGLAAALAAARGGARTLLVERAGFAGGIVTDVGLPYFDGIAAYHGEHRVVTPGIPRELLSKVGGCAPDATVLDSHTVDIDNIELFKLIADQSIAAEPNLDVLYHATACATQVSDDGRITTVYIADKAGLEPVTASVVIDCTGDADIAAFSGFPTAKNPELQPMTMHFRIGNVVRPDGPDPGGPLGRRCREALVRAHEAGDLPMFYGPGIMFAFAPNEAYVHAVRVPGDGSDPDDLTAAEMQGRADAWTMYRYWKEWVPEFAGSYFLSSGPSIGIRETRRIVGRHVLTEAEILSGTEFDDAIATGAWPLDRHPNELGRLNKAEFPDPVPYDIPFRTLVPLEATNLLVAGRCHSATAEACTSTRVTATAMAMGEAAGTAASMAVETRRRVVDLDGAEVRAVLRKKGAGPAEPSDVAH